MKISLMTASTKKLIMTAVIIIVMLVLMLSAFIFLTPLMFDVKDGAVVIPDPAAMSPETISQSVETIPEELVFKGTFNWEEKDGIREEDRSAFYLWIHVFEDETIAKFTFGETLNDGWPVELVTHTGNHYVLESSTRSFVERVRIVFDITDAGMSGTVENITPEISNFVRGSFVGGAISFEEYSVEVLN